MNSYPSYPNYPQQGRPQVAAPGPQQHPFAAAPTPAYASAPAAPAAPAGPAAPQGSRPAIANGMVPPPPRRRGRGGRRPEQPVNALRQIYRPAKQIAKPRQTLPEMDNTVKETRDARAGLSDGSKPLEVFRQEFLAQNDSVVLPLVIKRRDFVAIRHHIMRLQAKGRVDILDSTQFTYPVRLHRRDGRAPPSGAGSTYQEEDTLEDLEEMEARQKAEGEREERKRTREANQAQIAPTGHKKPPAFQKKTEQKYRDDNTPEMKKRRQLKYEETVNWHLEDWDNKQTWVGTHEAELSESHVMLTTDVSNGRDVVQMVPLERWYRFTVKNKIKPPTADRADETIKKQERVPQFLSNIENRIMKREHEYAVSGNRMRTRIGNGDDDEGAAIRRPRRGEDEEDVPVVKREADADDIDFNMDEDFADDEEGLNGLFEGDDEEVKDAQERLKRDHLGAAAFDLRNEEDVFRQEEKEKAAAEKKRKQEKAIRKALMKREKNPDYDYDSDNKNPYEESSEESETDSEAERQKAKEEQERKAAGLNGADKTASGASTKGSNTPSGLHKSVEHNKKKRPAPGSPELSEASGSESARKKHKQNYDGNRKSRLNDVSKHGAASGSDTEMADAGKPKPRITLRIGGGASPVGSPGGSRSGSPATFGQSRAASPVAPGGSATPLQSSIDTPSALELYRALPPEGMSISQLIAKFKGRFDSGNTQVIIKLIKLVAKFDKARHWVTPLPEMPSEASIKQSLLRAKAPKSAAASPS